MELLNLKVNPAAQYRMQSCRFVREAILYPLKEWLDQFVSKGGMFRSRKILSTLPRPWLPSIKKMREYQKGCELSRSQHAIGNNCEAAISTNFISMFGRPNLFCQGRQFMGVSSA